jgi:hypothetical protein
MIGWAPARWLLGLEAIPSDAPVVRWAWSDRWLHGRG